jgi:hypothetical protein
MDDESSKKLLEYLSWNARWVVGVVIMQNSIRVHTQLPNMSQTPSCKTLEWIKFQMETAYVIIEREVAASKGVVDYNVGARICYSLWNAFLHQKYTVGNESEWKYIYARLSLTR